MEDTVYVPENEENETLCDDSVCVGSDGGDSDGGADNAEERLSVLSGENEYLRKKLRCFELGVRPEFIDDTLKLSENSDIEEVVKNHPDFIGKNVLSDTGVLAVREKSSADKALRRAFGLA